MSTVTVSRTFTGIGTVRRSATGPVVQVRPAPALPLHEELTTDSSDRVRTAFAAVQADLSAMARTAQGQAREVLEATAEMADDPMLLESALRRVGSGIPPAHAVHEAVEEICVRFDNLGGYLAERVTDVRSVGHRVIAKVLDVEAPGVPALSEPAVIIAEDLAPADTAGLDPRLLLALVTEKGGPTGHTAIIAGQLGIPCVVRVAEATSIKPGTVVAVDGVTGRITTWPDDELIEHLTVRDRHRSHLMSSTAPGATKDGHAIDLLANVGSVSDAEGAMARGAQGIGLFRTELLYLDRGEAPSVAEQVEVYAKILASSEGAKVVIRTLDAGADKPLAFANQEGEPNPALGVRGYRLVRTNRQLLEDQLRAIAAASETTGTRPWVMAPMVAVVEEAHEFAALARECGVTTVGAMVEVPSAALLAGPLLEVLDFVSIGTNDLAQYTLAADRLQYRLSDLLDAWQPAVLQLVAMTARAGITSGKPVGVCGQSAADPAMALALAGLGVTSLSMPAGALAEIRYALKAHTLAECAELAEAAVGASTVFEAKEAVLRLMSSNVRDDLGLGQA